MKRAPDNFDANDEEDDMGDVGENLEDGSKGIRQRYLTADNTNLQKGQDQRGQRKQRSNSGKLLYQHSHLLFIAKSKFIFQARTEIKVGEAFLGQKFKKAISSSNGGLILDHVTHSNYFRLQEMLTLCFCAYYRK